jgi:hypothetical protein
MLELKQDLFIGVIGDKGIGKTTALLFLAELLLEEGLPDGNIKAFEFQDKDVLEFVHSVRRKLISVGKDAQILAYSRPSIYLVDGIDEPEKAEVIYLNGILIRITGNSSDFVINSWVTTVQAHHNLTNYSNFRLLKFHLRDLFLNEIKTSKRYKESITTII